MSQETLIAFALVALTGLSVACAAGPAAGAPASRPALEKMVLADYFPHHRTRDHDGRIDAWKQNLTAAQSKAAKTSYVWNPDLVGPDGRHQIASMVYPLVGMQSDLDEDYQEFQILTAKTAHIDGFMIEWVLPGPHSPDVLLRSLRKTAEKYDFKLGVNFIENCHFDWYPNAVDKSCDTREKLVEAYGKSVQYLLDTVYGWPTAMTIDGHALIFLFGGSAPVEVAKVRKGEFKMPAGVKDFWMIRQAGIAPEMPHTRFAYDKWSQCTEGSFGWVRVRYRMTGKEFPPEMLQTFDSYVDGDDLVDYQRLVMTLNDEYYQKGLHKIRYNSVCPRFDNRGCSGWSHSLWFMPDDDGAPSRRQWELIVENRDKIDGVLLVTWNDYTESTSVEPTVEYGFRDMEHAEKYGAAFKGIASDPSGIRLPTRLFELRKKGRFLARTGFDTRALSAALDRAGMDISGRKYKQAAETLKRAARTAEAMERQVVSRQVALKFPGPALTETAGAVAAEGVYSLGDKRPLAIRFAEPAAKVLRDSNFDGTIDFEYLDEGDSSFKILTSPARPDVPGPHNTSCAYSVVADIRKDKTGRWIKARVKVFKVNSGFTHQGWFNSDLAFVGDVKVRNISFAFELFARKP